MKKLYLHCGYHKTGSSFLQMMFARNRGFLTRNAIYFPASEGEYNMITGNISAGNGQKLAHALSNSDQNISSEFLKNRIRKAGEKNCNKLLISNEGLFHSFADERALKCLLNACKETGIEYITCLIYFRDPVSHAVSTYKHRAKNGKINEFSEWIESEYETVELLRKFTEYRSKFPIEWSCRKYKVDSRYMAESAFVDWLGVSLPFIPEDDEVNVSLTLSEIEVIRSLKTTYPNSVFYLKEEFKKLSTNEKAKDKEITLAHYNIAISMLKKYKSIFQEVNSSLRDGEKLVLQEAENQSITNQNSEIILSKIQLQAVSRALDQVYKSDKLITRIRVLLKKIGRKIKRKLTYRQALK